MKHLNFKVAHQPLTSEPALDSWFSPILVELNSCGNRTRKAPWSV